MNRLVSLSLLAAVLAMTSGCRTTGLDPATEPRTGADSYEVVGSLERLDPAFDALVPSDARIERIATGFGWSEGPVWRQSEGYLLFTDIPNNVVHRWSDEGGLEVFLRPSGYAGPNPPGGSLGSNGLTFDAQDRLLLADHGNRRVARLDESNFTTTTLVDRYRGQRLNSPNDLIVRSNGDIYFTDPPYGLDRLYDSPHMELEFSGVYRLTPDGELTLLERELRFPNGVAFSPDEQTLYVSNSDPEHAVWMAYDVNADGSLSNRRVLFDATPLVREGRQGNPDGIAIDQQGNLFATGPGGVLVITPEGQHLGTIQTGRPTASAAFGDDGSTLFMTAHMDLMRVRLNTTGLGFDR